MSPPAIPNADISGLKKVPDPFLEHRDDGKECAEADAPFDVLIHLDVLTTPFPRRGIVTIRALRASPHRAGRFVLQTERIDRE